MIFWHKIFVDKHIQIFIKKDGKNMANMNELFLKFDEKIKLTTAKSNNLKTSRDALRTDIKQWFEDNDKKQPNFCWQGSFAMKTTINPIGINDYDMDDGVYLNGYSSEQDTWPATSTVHKWIKDATDDRTEQDTIDKNTCVRVVYADHYHIDLPIYIMKDEIPYLAHKTNGWIESDPKAFKDWFLEKISNNGEQLRRLVRYLKGWKDYNDLPLKGIELTILASENFDSFENRDDKSLKNTVSNIITKLEEDYVCNKPVIPNENLFEGHSETRKNEVIDAFKNLKNILEEVFVEQDEECASQKLIALFGSRFPKDEKSQAANYQKTSAPGVLKHDGRSG